MVEDLRLKNVGKNELRFYTAWFFVIAITCALSLVGVLWDANLFESSTVKYLDLIMTTLLVPVQLLVAYKANSHGDGKDFWYRFFSINFSLSITMLLIGFVVGLVMTNIFRSELTDSLVGYPDILTRLTLYIIFIHLTYSYMGDVARKA